MSQNDQKSSFELHSIGKIIVQEEDLLFRQMPDLKPPELVNLEKMVLVGWMSYVAPESRSGAVDSALFKRALSENAITGAREALWEVQMLPTPRVQQEMGFLGVQTTAEWVSTDRFVIKIIQGGRFLRFSHPALANYREAARRYCYHTFIPKSGLQLAKPIELERLGEVDTLFLPVERNLE